MMTECNQQSFRFHALGRRNLWLDSMGVGSPRAAAGFCCGRLSGARESFANSLYEDEYCARGDMENRIKEQQLCLFADRTSAATMRANELRLWFSSVAYTLMTALRRLGLEGTDLSKARCDTIRLKLLKIGGRIRVTVRNVWVSLAESCPYQDLFRQVYDHLARLSPIPLRC